MWGVKNSSTQCQYFFFLGATILAQEDLDLHEASTHEDHGVENDPQLRTLLYIFLSRPKPIQT